MSHPLIEKATVPFRQVYEVVRVATFSDIDLNAFSVYLKHTVIDDYSFLWNSLGAVVRARGGNLPDRSSATAWTEAGNDFSGISLSGKLVYLDSPKGPPFRLRFFPLRVKPSYRLSRKFGADRFLVIAIPGLGPDSLPTYLKASAVSVREAIVEWLATKQHKVLGRTWRAFFTKPEATNKGQKTRIKSEESRFNIHLFAEDGMYFRQGPPTGELDPRRPDRPRMSVKEMLEWFVPLKANQHQPCLKLFARLALGNYPCPSGGLII